MLPARPCRSRPRPSGPRPPRGAREFRGTGNAHLMTRRRLRFGVRGVENLPCRPDKAATRVFFISRRVCLRPRGSRTLPVPRVPSGPARPFSAFLASSQACRAPKYYSLSPPRAHGPPAHSGRAMSRYRECLETSTLSPPPTTLADVRGFVAPCPSWSVVLEMPGGAGRRPPSGEIWTSSSAESSTRTCNLFTCLCWIRPPSDIYLFEAMMRLTRRKTDASKRKICQ